VLIWRLSFFLKRENGHITFFEKDKDGDPSSFGEVVLTFYSFARAKLWRKLLKTNNDYGERCGNLIVIMAIVKEKIEVNVAL